MQKTTSNIFTERVMGLWKLLQEPHKPNQSRIKIPEGR